jgi:hypothetical protein
MDHSENDFPGTTAEDRRLEEMAIGAVQRRTSSETYHARVVQLLDAEGRVLWEPKAHACHSNVETWVRYSAAHKRIRGFLLQGPIVGFWKVLAHSLVQVEDGSLIEITPREGNQPHPFVRHLGTDDEFDAFADRAKLIVRPQPHPAS